MSNDLNTAYAELRAKCAELDKAGYEIRDKGAIEEYLKISLMKMLICISTCDDKMTKPESDFITSTLGVTLTSNAYELERLKKMITPDSVTDSL